MSNPFKRKKVVEVATAAYNMAGDEDLRPNYMKTTIFSHVITHNPNSLTSTITNNYLNGPGVKLKNFAAWARNKGYNDTIGIIAGSLSAGDSVDESILAGQLPHDPGSTVLIQTTEIGEADYYYWVLKKLAEDFPELLGKDFEANFIEDENTIYIFYGGDIVTSFEPDDFNTDSRYLYVSYNTSTGTVEGPIVEGPVNELGEGDPWPDVSGWTQVSYVEEQKTADLEEITHTLVTYSDGRPNEESESSVFSQEDFTSFEGVYSITHYLGESGDTLLAEKVTQTQMQSGYVDSEITQDTTTEIIEDGVIKTTTVTKTTESLKITRKYREDTQEIVVNSWTPLKYFIYRYESGNTLIDGMFAPLKSQGEYFPFIPIRRDNRFYDETYFPEIYEASKKAYRKIFNGRLSDVIKVVEDNPSLGDIDHAFIVFGVSLNVKENACKKYIYNYFKALIEDPDVTDYDDYQEFKNKFNAAHQSWVDWIEWREQAAEPGDPDYMEEPTRLSYPTFKGSSVRITNVPGSGSPLYDMTINWTYIVEQEGEGLLKPDAKRGELWFEVADPEEFPTRQWESGGLFAELIYTFDHVILNWQVDENTWKRLVFGGLWHKNNIYRGRTINTRSHIAILDDEESGFIVPLHEEIFNTMSLVDRTQMSTACSFILFNCYEVTKQKWYETDAFKLFLVAGSIFLTAISFGAGVGLLGTSAGVGAALGFTGLVAVIVGSIANALAAVLLVYLIQLGAVEIFGEKIGAIVGAIVSVIALHVGTSMATGKGAAAGFLDLMKPDKMLQLTNAAGNGYAQYLNISTQEIQQKTSDMVREYEATTEELEQMVRETFGTFNSILDPMAIIETRDSFLARTLMTGADIVNLGITLIDRFVDMSLNTQLQP